MAVWLMLVLLDPVLGLVGATTAAWWVVGVGAVLLLLGLLIRFRRSER